MLFRLICQGTEISFPFYLHVFSLCMVPLWWLVTSDGVVLTLGVIHFLGLLFMFECSQQFSVKLFHVKTDF
jgi:hypothetical protein